MHKLLIYRILHETPEWYSSGTEDITESIDQDRMKFISENYITEAVVRRIISIIKQMNKSAMNA